MSANTDQTTETLSRVLKGHDWRKPGQAIYGNEDGQKLPKKGRGRVNSSGTDSSFDFEDPSTHYRRPIGGVSSLRSASNIGFATSNTHDWGSDAGHHQKNVHSAAGIVNYVAIKAPSNKCDAPTIVDLDRPLGKQYLRPGADRFTVDIVLRDPRLHGTPEWSDNNDDFPFALIEEIRSSDRFKPLKTFQARQHDLDENCSQSKSQKNDCMSAPRNEVAPKSGASSPKQLDTATKVILCDQAVVSVSGINGHATHEVASAATKQADFASIVDKLRQAGRDCQIRREAGIHTTVEGRSKVARKVSHAKEGSADSTDSGVAMKLATTSTDTLRREKSSTSLNPAAAEFVAQSTRFIDPAIIEQSCNGRVERMAEVERTEKLIDKQLAIAQAFNDIANFSRDSLDNLHEVVQKTIQKYGLPGSPEGLSYTTTSPAYSGTVSCGSFPPTPPSDISVQAHPTIPIAPSSGLGLPPFSGTGTIPPSQAPLGFVPPSFPPPFMGAHGPLPPTSLPGHVGPFSSPPFSTSSPPYPPVYHPGFGFRPVPLPATTNMAPMPTMGHPMPPRKPRIPDTMSQLEYEAHIEWRKANEPGYALKCRERQARRNCRSSKSSSTDFTNTATKSESGSTW